MKVKMKVKFVLAALIVMSLTLSGCAASSSKKNPTPTKRPTATVTPTTAPTEAPPEETTPAEAAYTLKIGSVLADTDPIVIALQNMAERINGRTNGALAVEVYHSSELGDTAALLEQLKSGENVGVIVDTGVLATYVPDMAIYTAPYVFDSIREARKFIDTEIFADWDAQLAENGIRDLSFNFYQGARHFLTNVKVEKPADLEGVRLRTMGSDVAQNSMKAFSAVPVTMPWGDVYEGIKSNELIDGAEGQITAVYGANLHEVISYIAESGHFLLYTGLVISEAWYAGLPEEYQLILMDEARSAGDDATDLTLSKEIEYKVEMEEKGVTFVAVDIEPFKEASKSVYDIMGWQELKAKIDQALGK